MRIVFSADWYSEGMGYMENVIPRRFAELGHDVYLISSTMQVYGDHAFYDDVYGKFLGKAILDPGETVVEGVKVIRLPISCWWKRFKIAKGRTRLIRSLDPDIVYAWDPRSYQTVMISLAAWFSRFKLFTGNHTVASVYPAYYSYKSWSTYQRLYLRLSDTLFGWVSGLRTSTCFSATPDACEIAHRFFGLPESKVKHLPLGLDTHLFRPRSTEDDEQSRQTVRSQLGIAPDELLCIYTGRLTEGKNPHCLAQAITLLRKGGYKFRAIFLGEGEQREAIEREDGCVVKPFAPYRELAKYYRAADIGVWPRQESISMTDAAACALPIIVSNRMKAVERVNGNGATYDENDAQDLMRALLELRDPGLRAQLGQCGADKMRSAFSIETMADRMLLDFQAAIGTKND